MDPSILIWLEILIYGVLFTGLMYFVAVRGPIARKVRDWFAEAREARIKKRRERSE